MKMHGVDTKVCGWQRGGRMARVAGVHWGVVGRERVRRGRPRSALRELL